MQLESFIDVDAFTKEITEEIADLNEAMRTQTARAAFYSINATKAKKQKDKVALIVKTVEAQLTKTMRKQLLEAEAKLAEDEGRKIEKITVDMVRAEVSLHPQMRKYLELQIDADEIYAVCKAAYDAFYTRREMLTSMGHMARAQMATNMTIQNAQQSVAGYRDRRAAREAGRSEQQQ